MSARPQPSAPHEERIARLYGAKSAEELRIAASIAPQPAVAADRGPLDARVVLVKGLAGPAEASGLPALSGPDGQAAASALEALGFDPDSLYAVVSRADADAPSDAPETLALRARLRATIEAVDPYAVVALDGWAAEDLAAAFGVPVLGFGVVTRVAGRSFLAVDGLEASLTDESRKRDVWRQLKGLGPRSPLW